MPAERFLDRRAFLTKGAATMLGAAALPALTGPGRGITRVVERLLPDDLRAGAAAMAAKPKYGGTLIVGSDGGDQDTLDPQHNSTDMDQQRIQNLYNAPIVINSAPPYSYEWDLAETIELNADATVATVVLKKGIEFHNGKTLT
ncbi:MAG TPA: hypothetical protein VME46_10320, partial [Acidimicrobiales bacterium]|nr:hypothetical protein [Acidimicrobiales bacterium]